MQPSNLANTRRHRELGQPDEQEEDTMVDLSELKALAKKLLPSSSTTRILILSEPDVLPRDLALAKMEVFANLLCAELGRPSR